MNGLNKKFLALVALMALALSFFVAVPAAFAATLSPTVSTSGTLYTGSNASTVTISFVAQTAIPAGGGIYFNSEGLNIPGCQTYPATCSDVTISASLADLSGAVVTTKYVYGGSYYQFITSVPNAVGAGETVSITFPASKLSIGSTSAWFEIGTYSQPVNTGQIMLNRLDVSGRVNVGAVNPPATVTFTAGGGSGTMAPQTASTATPLTANQFTKTGYVFSHWSDSQMPWISFNDGDTYNFSSGVTLVANWVAVYSVTYDSHGGSAVADGSFRQFGNIATLAAAPTRSGYTFNGWFLAATGGAPLGDGYTPTTQAPLTLHAQWTVASRTVTFDSNGGTGIMSPQISSSSAALSANQFSKSGFTFSGWNTAADGSGLAYAPGGSHPFSSDETLFAQWATASRTLTFDANGGLGTMTPQVSITAAVISDSDFSRSGYGFTGWNTMADGSGTAYAPGATFPFSSNGTLYAQWRDLPPAPIAEVDIQVPIGASIANAPVALDIDGLKDETGYVVTVFSTPQIIDQGTIWSGRLNTTVRIPSNLEAGWHRLVIEGTAADGTPWTETNYFKVSPGGLLLATSEVVPAELAYTGAKQTTGGILGGTLFALGALLVGTRLMSRRRHKA